MPADRGRVTQLPAPRQADQVELRDSDPIAWLRDKANRRVPVDTRGELNAQAVLRVCALADLGDKAAS